MTEESGEAGARPLRLRVNGTLHELSVEPRRLLADVLREDLRLTGTKIGCGIGVCGSCSVLIDGRLMTACLLLAMQADGSEVTTVEGLASGDTLSALQRSFIQEGGFQCGICTPGQLIAATALLTETRGPTDVEIGDFMNGNLCRCTGYHGILRSILAAAAPDA